MNLKAAAVQPGNLFSLDMVSIENSANGDDDTSLLLSGMEVFGPDNAVRHYAIPLVDVDDTTDEVAPVGLSPRLFVGRGALAADAGTLTFLTSNALNETLEVSCMGYMWGPEATSQSRGGPRRPADGMFPQ